MKWIMGENSVVASVFRSETTVCFARKSTEELLRVDHTSVGDLSLTSH